MLSRRIVLPAVVALVLGGGAFFVVAQKMKLPKPQGTFTEGEAAPDFTLKDQDGRPFHLADLRGTAVLLIFYRGYW